MKWLFGNFHLLILFCFFAIAIAIAIFVLGRYPDSQISMEPLMNTRDASTNVMTRYNPDNFDLTYHELTPYGDIYDTKMKEITVLNENGQMTVLPYAPSQNLPVYYNPTEKKDVKPFIPSYTESVLLSNASTPVTNTTLTNPNMTTTTTHPYAAVSISIQRKSQ